jgi:hypothetical protein
MQPPSTETCPSTPQLSLFNFTTYITMAPPSPKLVSAIDESGSVVCAYARDAKDGSWKAIVRAIAHTRIVKLLEY